MALEDELALQIGLIDVERTSQRVSQPWKLNQHFCPGFFSIFSRKRKGKGNEMRIGEQAKRKSVTVELSGLKFIYLWGFFNSEPFFGFPGFSGRNSSRAFAVQKERLEAKLGDKFVIFCRFT